MVVHPAEQIIRFKLALAALLCGLAALYVQYTGVLPRYGEVVASVELECGLIPTHITLGQLKETVSAPRFEAMLAVPASIEGGEQPNRLHLCVSHPDERVAEEVLANARQLLAMEVEDLGMRDIARRRRLVEEWIEKERSRKKERRLHRLSQEMEPVSESLSAKDARQIIQLRKEIKQLEAYHQGGRYPLWLKAKIDGKVLRSVNRRLRKAEGEFTRYKGIFPAGHNNLRAQKKLLRELKTEKRQLVRELASGLLASHKLELEALERKSHDLIEEARRSNAAAVAARSEPPEPDKDMSEYFRAETQKIENLAKRQQAMSKLKKVSGPHIVEHLPLGYWVSFGFWCGSMLCLLGALFIRSRSQVAPKAGKPGPTPIQAPVSKKRLELGSESQLILQGLYERLRKNLGREPQRILVLGNETGQARSSFSLRLAKTFGSGERRIKLVDFDLPEKELSQRLGDRFTPGVGDILARGGPVEEFFASVPGTNIEFAAAGSHRVLREPICAATLNSILDHPRAGVTLVDASFNSPLHLLIEHVDAVLCLTQPGVEWKEQEEQVLLALRDAKLPLWGVAQGGAQIFPFI